MRQGFYWVHGRLKGDKIPNKPTFQKAINLTSQAIGEIEFLHERNRQNQSALPATTLMNLVKRCFNNVRGDLKKNENISEKSNRVLKDAYNAVIDSTIKTYDEKLAQLLLEEEEKKTAENKKTVENGENTEEKPLVIEYNM